jgi:hypothetical protein
MKDRCDGWIADCGDHKTGPQESRGMAPFRPNAARLDLHALDDAGTDYCTAPGFGGVRFISITSAFHYHLIFCGRIVLTHERRVAREEIWVGVD